MLRVLLVDDEAIIKQGLRDQIAWEDLGFIVSGEASDGKEALRMIRSDPPDLVISDIQMPFKAGLELMEDARMEYPGMRFLFISGHDEFRYVQKALKLGAADYILKPIAPVYLSGRLKDIAAEAMDQNRSRAALTMSRQTMIRHQLQSVVFDDRTDRVQLIEEAAGIPFDAADAYYTMISFQIDRYFQRAEAENGKELESMRRGFHDIVRDFPKDKAFRLTEDLREYDICLVSQDKDTMKSLIEDLLDGLARTRQNRDFTVTVGLSDGTGHIEKLGELFRQAREARELKFLLGEDGVYTSEHLRNISENKVGQPSLDSAVERLTVALKEGDETGIHPAIQALTVELGNTGDPREALSWTASRCLLGATTVLEELGYSLEEAIDDPMSAWGDLNNNQTAEGFLDELAELLASVARYVAKRKNMRSSQILDQAIGYLRENFADPKVSLDSAAAEACMSPCYFSVLFKQETGENFQRHLTKLRIEKAKDLILYTDKKSYEIAPEVGYENASYFSTVFKKSTGMSPSEYRKQFA